MDAGVRAALPPTRAKAEPETEPRPDHAPEGNTRNVPRAMGMTLYGQRNRGTER